MSDTGWDLQRAYDEGYKDGKRDAAAAIEALQAEVEEQKQIAAHYEQAAKDYWKEACDYKAEVKRLQDKLCDWCSVCPKERRKPEDCEMLSETPVMYGPSDAKIEVRE